MKRYEAMWPFTISRDESSSFDCESPISPWPDLGQWGGAAQKTALLSDDEQVSTTAAQKDTARIEARDAYTASTGGDRTEEAWSAEEDDVSLRNLS